MLLLRLLAVLAAVGAARGHSHPAAACLSEFCQVQLSPDLTLRYLVLLPDGHDGDDFDQEECPQCRMTVQLLYDGEAWVGFGVSHKGEMVGSHAVIGEPGHSVGMYYLDGKDAQYVVEDPTQALENPAIDFIEGQTILEFTIALSDFDAGMSSSGSGGGSWASLSLTGRSTFIWAHGNDGEAKRGYHGSNRGPLTIENLLTLSGSEAKSFDEHIAPSKSSWVAHGILGFLAWGIFAPLAISTAKLADCEVPAFLQEKAAWVSKRWLYIHVGLNAATYTITVIVFSIAVSTINSESFRHWDSGHAKMGLTIFLIATFQIVGGYFRPASGIVKRASGEEESEEGEDEANNEEGAEAPATKSTKRQAWEVAHALIGVMLFIFGFSQMYSGIQMYAGRYSNSSPAALLAFFFLWMIFWTGVIFGGTLYKLVWQQKELERTPDHRGIRTYLLAVLEPFMDSARLSSLRQKGEKEMPESEESEDFAAVNGEMS
ncbi:hypothetical protein ACHAXT_000915 [Thalassiosira profunda]